MHENVELFCFISYCIADNLQSDIIGTGMRHCSQSACRVSAPSAARLVLGTEVTEISIFFKRLILKALFLIVINWSKVNRLAQILEYCLLCQLIVIRTIPGQLEQVSYFNYRWSHFEIHTMHYTLSNTQYTTHCAPHKEPHITNYTLNITH